ncbi:hypothetical protein DL89DRAFT_293520 [Linderina pennispora]|uniref:Uncharacterized protein n=1 Tax=Linderina pennispora TaxID=61395 RepID=A0A1Y1W685_9FUNG|nr:uncharacterized protein DL89DRAFT_293520 [Linderina pennispora]ORX69053.1 hypothetical protein DL89DRAFT_293520 [Linderina pennispora]
MKYPRDILNFFRLAPAFSGKLDGMSSESWLGIMPAYVHDFLEGYPDYIIVQCLQRKLSGVAYETVGRRRYATPAQLLEDLARWFPQEIYRKEAQNQIDAGLRLANGRVYQVRVAALSVFDRAGRNDGNAVEICRQISQEYPKIWEKLEVDPDMVTAGRFEQMLVRFDSQVQESAMHLSGSPFGHKVYDSDHGTEPTQENGCGHGRGRGRGRSRGGKGNRL